MTTLGAMLALALVVVGAVLITGERTPVLITREMMQEMKQRSVFIDVSIDQGGCAETSKPTTHSAPTYIVDGVVHYCVSNMPGAVARTSTFALNNATLPFTLQLAAKGYRRALLDNPHLKAGLNAHRCAISYEAVAPAQRKTFAPVEKALAA